MNRSKYMAVSFLCILFPPVALASEGAPGLILAIFILIPILVGVIVGVISLISQKDLMLMLLFSLPVAGELIALYMVATYGNPSLLISLPFLVLVVGIAPGICSGLITMLIGWICKSVYLVARQFLVTRNRGVV